MEIEGRSLSLCLSQASLSQPTLSAGQAYDHMRVSFIRPATPRVMLQGCLLGDIGFPSAGLDMAAGRDVRLSGDGNKGYR